MNRHSRGLQSIVFTLSQSVPELGLLIMILIISGLIFASLTYYIEMVNNCHKYVIIISIFRKMILDLLTSLLHSTGSLSPWPLLGEFQYQKYKSSFWCFLGMETYFPSLDLASLWEHSQPSVELWPCHCHYLSLSAILKSGLKLFIFISKFKCL